MKKRHLSKIKIHEILCTGQWHFPFKGGTLGPHTVLPSPSAALSYFPESHWWSEISSLSKVILILGKARSCRAPNWGCRGAESSGWFDVSPKNSAWDEMRRDVWAGGCCDEAASYQLPIAVAFWIIRIVSVEECSSLAQNLMQIRCSAHSVILNVMATQDTCSLNGIYCPHWLVQWSRHCSHMHIPVHSPLLPGYINVLQTVLVILTMAGLFWTDLLYVIFTICFFMPF